MLRSGVLTKSAIPLFRVTSAIAGCLVAGSVMLSSATAVEPHIIQLAANPTAPTEDTDVNRFTVMAIALGGAVGVCLGLNVLLGANRSSHASARVFAKPLAIPNHGAKSSLGQVNSRLQRKLVRLLHDDRAAASRLVTQASLRYPGKTPDWYAEKVIYDLERDRGSY